MSKYEPLAEFLRRQSADLIPMKFEDIERVVGSKLPESSRQHRAWWSNNPNNNVMTRVWVNAGFNTEQVDIEGRRLVFRRIRARNDNQAVPPASGAAPEAGKPGTRPRHPLFGALKGLLRVMPGTDLTKPADPTWGEK